MEKSKGQQPINSHVDSDSPPRDEAWFANAQVSYANWKVLNINLDRDVLEWYQSRWKNYRNRFNQVLEAYRNRKLNVAIPVKEYSTDRVKVVGKYAPEVVDWIKSKPNSDGFMSLILRDFMLTCLEKEQREGKIVAGDNCCK